MPAQAEELIELRTSLERSVRKVGRWMVFKAERREGGVKAHKRTRGKERGVKGGEERGVIKEQKTQTTEHQIKMLTSAQLRSLSCSHGAYSP
jgi:hypothetical protein